MANKVIIDPSVFTQILEEVDLLRMGMDIITAQILQNAYYKNQDIHTSGNISVTLIKRNGNSSEKFESKLNEKWRNG